MATQTKKAGSRIWEKRALLLRLAQWKRLTSSPWNWRSFSQEPSSRKQPCPARAASSGSCSAGGGKEGGEKRGGETVGRKEGPPTLPGAQRFSGLGSPQPCSAPPFFPSKMPEHWGQHPSHLNPLHQPRFSANSL